MRRTGAVAVMALMLGGLLAANAPAASAQTGYPPGLCNVLSGTQFAGNVAVGQTFTVTLSPACVFTVGATVNVVVNGVAAVAKVVAADGTVSVTINVLSTTQLSINPIVPAVCGVNTVVGSGPSAVAGGRTVTQTATFNLTCPSVAPAAASKDGLARTGLNVAKWGVGALALLGIGGLAVRFGRRRSATS